MKKSIKFMIKATLASCIALASTANAELVANVPLDVSRYEIMPAANLIAMAKQGNLHAQFYLATRYKTGNGIDQNAKQAIYWYAKAAKQGVAPAQLNLGQMYLRGEGVNKNLTTARYWLEQAAKRGDNRASYTLALLDEQSQNLVDAYKWYDLAARNEMLSDPIKDRARNKIGQLAANLSNQDIANAKNNADRWLQN